MPDLPHYPTSAETSVRIRPATSFDRERWDSYVLSSSHGTFFHRYAWRDIFSDIFGLVPHYLLAEQGSTVVGVLPLVHQKSFLFGNALIAAPFCVEGGVLSDNDVIDTELTAAALSLRKQTRASYVEFRSRRAKHPDWLTQRDIYATFARDISSNDDANLLAIPRKQRAVVRKTLGSGLKSAVDPDVERLFRVYSESVRNLGTPVFPKKYFSALKSAFGDACDIVVVTDKEQPVSAVMNFYHGNTVLPYYGGGTSGARTNGANDFLYWEVIRRSAARGFSRFDFGRSKADTGAFAFKKNWGFVPEWLEYEFYLGPGQALPNKNPLNPKYRLLIQTWKRLPLPVANLIGPFLVPGLG